MNILKEIKALKFPKGQYIVVCSGIMAMHNIKTVNDIDVTPIGHNVANCNRRKMHIATLSY